MKTDSIFYRIFKFAPHAFFELIGEADPRTATYAFTSQAVKQTSFNIDGIFLPPPRLRQFPIYFVEAHHYAEYEHNPRLQRIDLNKLPPEVGERTSVWDSCNC